MITGGTDGLVSVIPTYKLTWTWHPFPESTTDIGLPQDQTRDEGWNTNNPIESAFRVFDLVFLNLLQNKRWDKIRLSQWYHYDSHIFFKHRIDRLGSILLMDFFPYYQHWPFNERRWSKEYITLTRKGHDLWEGNWIYKNNNTYMVLATVLVIAPVWLNHYSYLSIKKAKTQERQTCGA